jgi:plastocyanin
MGTPGASPVPGPRDDGTNLWQVQVGGMDMEERIDMHAFFPKEITINAGDGIHFAFAPMGMPGFHTVTFTSGEELPPLFVPEMADGTPVASESGEPRILINPQVAWPDGRQEYDGTGFTNSGLDVLRMETDPPYILNFTTPGTYEYVCAVHFVVMKGTIIVQEAGAELPMDQADYDAAAAGEYAALLDVGGAAIAQAEAKTATPAADSPTTWDVAAGVGGLTSARVMRFFPEEVTVKVGDTVRWTNMTDGEPHTVTFLGGEEPPEDVLIEPSESGPPTLLQNLKSLLPTAESEFDGTMYSNSGFIGFPPEISEPLGLVMGAWELTFTTAGEFPYYCILHSSGPESEGEMNGRIIVEE